MIKKWAFSDQNKTCIPHECEIHVECMLLEIEIYVNKARPTAVGFDPR